VRPAIAITGKQVLVNLKVLRRPATGCVRRRQRLQHEREQLPVHIVRERLLAELRKAQTAVLVGETGSGKTTQVPRLLLESGLAHGGSIACTQPRRVAAITIAQRVAAEMGTVVGGLVRAVHAAVRTSD